MANPVTKVRSVVIVRGGSSDRRVRDASETFCDILVVMGGATPTCMAVDVLRSEWGCCMRLQRSVSAKPHGVKMLLTRVEESWQLASQRWPHPRVPCSTKVLTSGEGVC